jgi:VWFA-related protein
MRLLNSRVRILLFIFIIISLAGLGVSAPGQSSSPTTSGQSSGGGIGSAPATPPSSSVGAGQEGPAEPAPSPTQTRAEQGQPSSSQSAPSPDQAQTPPDQPASDQDNGVFVFKKEVEEVVVHATVVDDKNRIVTTLDKSAFTVLENGAPQSITSFRREDVPVAMGIVIDNSGSMREKRDKVNKAALNLVRSSNPQDQVFVVNFNDEYYLDQGFTSDISKLKEALEKVEARGGTALYDAIVASADYEKANARLQKKVLFVVTDGEDNASRETLEQAVLRLQQENSPTVYAIGLLGEEKAHRARRALETIAQRTGGIAFLPRTVEDVDDISRTVAHDIRSQYTIGYKPTTPKSAGGYRAIKVEAKAKGFKQLTVRTRSGYYPGQEQQ